MLEHLKSKRGITEWNLPNCCCYYFLAKYDRGRLLCEWTIFRENVMRFCLQTLRTHKSKDIYPRYIRIYYLDKSVLVQKWRLLKFIRNYIRDSSGVFSIISFTMQWGYRWRHLPLLHCSYTFVYTIQRNLHGGLKMWILFSRGKKRYFTTRKWNSYLRTAV